jgi:hypothetical protein
MSFSLFLRFRARPLNRLAISFPFRLFSFPLFSGRGMGGNAAVFFDSVVNGLTIHDVRQVPPIISLEVMLCHVQST